MPAPPIANIPPEYVGNCSFEVFRPFGSSSPFGLSTGTLIDGFACGVIASPDLYSYTHVLYVDPETNIRDGMSRLGSGNSLLYTDGDEVRAYNYEGYTRFVVVWVSIIRDATVGPDAPSGYKAVYLMRHENVIL